MIEFISIAMSVVEDVSPGRLVETLLALTLVWSRVKPFLKKYDERLENLEKAVCDGFKNGETRFQAIEGEIKEVKSRVTVLETTKA